MFQILLYLVSNTMYSSIAHYNIPYRGICSQNVKYI
nr:MAG TPA: hypothetical protein [Caudoviricetes sp.]